MWVKGHKPWFIYALRDPRNFDVRYVGYTVNLEDRYCCHLSEAESGRKSHKCSWLRQMFCEGLAPLMQVLEEGAGPDWVNRERYWISLFRSLEPDLTNEQDGGEGGWSRLEDYHTGRKRSPESRKRMSEAALKRLERPEERERILKLNCGRTPSNKGKKRSLETRLKLIEAWKRRRNRDFIKNS